MEDKCSNQLHIDSFNNKQQSASLDLIKRSRLLSLLKLLTSLLKERGYWQLQQPSDAQLASHQPFAIDTLTFTQWLQFIFIIRLTTIIEMDESLPTAISIAPMSSQVLPNELALFKLLTQIDLLVSE